jgi:broad specificity phosphatase PhoE
MTYGDHTLALIDDALGQGATHVVLLMRHSAREFASGRHDLHNPLTEEGRALSRRLGQSLPKELLLRGYSSPADRCIETADLILEAHNQHGGEITRNRAVEALGVFYILDQMKMFMSMREADGLSGFLHQWFEGQIGEDIMIPADLAASLVARVCTEKLKSPSQQHQLDVLVSHDVTVFTLRDRLLNQKESQVGGVNFLDGLVFFRVDEEVFIQSHHGPRQSLGNVRP